jgi:enoyl-CoA hydratase/carnithine racemase
MSISFPTIQTVERSGVLHARIAAPHMNLIGPELIRDLVSLIQHAEDTGVRVVVFSSADPDYFIAHVDVTKVAAYREEAARLVGEASIGMLFRRLSEASFVSIAQIEGRVRGAGSEFVLACDMRFAAKETAIFSQMEGAFGLVPGAGAVQHLTRLMGRGRALEIMLGADDHSADLAERYGWINRALPAADLPAFVAALAHRIAAFPQAGQSAIRERVNQISLADEAAFRKDSELFGIGVTRPGTQKIMQAAMAAGFQSREGEMALGDVLVGLAGL